MHPQDDERERNGSCSNNNSSSGGGGGVVVPPFYLSILLHMSSGILHLHSSHLVHRDIALRNFLVSTNHRILLCDFGLSRKIENQKQAYYQIDATNQPLRWMAPEALMTHKFDRKTDVWSFGVACWEVLTAGRCLPYQHVHLNTQVICGVATGTLKPDFSGLRRGALRELLESCTCFNANDRPSMQHVVHTLQSLLQQAEHQQLLLHQQQQQHPTTTSYNYTSKNKTISATATTVTVT